MAVSRPEELPIQREEDIVRVRQKVREWTVDLGFGLVDQTKVVTAASELARNTMLHGGGGTVLLEVLNQGGRKGLRLTFEDRGPGIPDVDLALKDGYTTGTGMGLGLGGSKRLMNEFSLSTRAGEGTRVTVVKWR